jgi:phospholipid/cholesterol/gamma-HCH transport system substrate-binding protein
MKISTEAKIGIFVVISLALLIWGVNFLKGKNVFKSTDKYYSVYENIEGLVASGIIYLNGYKIGTVSKIKFDAVKSRNIIVEFSLEQKVRIPRNSHFQIYSASFVSGIKDVRLVLSNEPGFYSPGDTVPGSFDQGLTGIIDPITTQVASTMGKLDSILSSLNNLLDPETVSGLKGTLTNVNQISSSLDRSFTKGGNIDRSLSNLAVFTETLKNNSDELSAIFANFKQVSDSLADSQLKAAIDNANSSLANISGILRKIDQGEGTAGMLVNNDSLYINLQSVSKSLDFLLVDLREHPKRYVHFSLFGRKN